MGNKEVVRPALSIIGLIEDTLKRLNAIYYSEDKMYSGLSEYETRINSILDTVAVCWHLLSPEDQETLLNFLQKHAEDKSVECRFNSRLLFVRHFRQLKTL